MLLVGMGGSSEMSKEFRGEREIESQDPLALCKWRKKLKSGRVSLTE